MVWAGVQRLVAVGGSRLGKVSLSLILPLAVAGLMVGATCGAPDVVMRGLAHPAGGGNGGESSSSSSDGTGGVAGVPASTSPEGGSSAPASTSSSGGSIATGGRSSSGGTGGSGGVSTTGGRGGAGGASASGGRGGSGGASASGGSGGGGGARGGSTTDTGGARGGGTTDGGVAGGSDGSTNPFGGVGAGGATGTSSGGSGAAGGTGGSSSSSPPPPVSGLGVFVSQKITGGPGQIALSLRIDNKTAQSVDMTTVTLRYWYQDEGLGAAVVLATNYVSIGYSNTGKVTGGKAVANPSPAPGADHYLELSFSGTLAAQGDKSSNDQFNAQVTLHTASYTGAVDLTNDYSYNGGASGSYNDKITLHNKNGDVIWGTAPGKGSPIPPDAGAGSSRG